MRRGLLVGTVALFACGGSNNGDMGGLESAGGKADEAIACPDAPITYQDPGDDADAAQRLAALQTYADGLMLAQTCALDETFADSGLGSTQRLDGYDLVVGPDGCLDDTLDSDGQNEEAVLQVEAVVGFLADFHEDMLGRRTHLFNKVHICPKDTYDGDMQLDMEAKRLGIGTSYSLLGFGMAPDSTDNVHTWWENGEHIDGYESVEAWNGEFWVDGTDDLWAVLDPVGEPRMSLRDELQMQADSAATQLAALEEAEALDEDEVAKLIMATVNNDTENRNIRTCALGVLENGSSRDAEEMVRLWRSALDKPGGWNALAETLIAQVQPPTAIAGHSVAKKCATESFGNIELPHISVRDYLMEDVGVLTNYVKTIKDTDEYEEGSVSCAFEVDGDAVVATANHAITTMAIDHALYEMDIDCDDIAVEEPEPEPEEPAPGDDDDDDPTPDPADDGGDGDPDPDPDDGGDDGTDPDPDPADGGDDGDADGGKEPADDGGADAGDDGDPAGDDDDDDAPAGDDDDDDAPAGDDDDDDDDDSDPFGDDGNDPFGDDDDDDDDDEGGEPLPLPGVDDPMETEGGCSVGAPSRSTGTWLAGLFLMLGFARRRRS